MSGPVWQPGDVIVRREVWRERAVCAWAGYVAYDDGDLLALWMPSDSPLAMTDEFFGGPHPWGPRTHWHGPGVLQLQRPGDAYSVWHGEGRDFQGWYVNLQEPFKRTLFGIDTMDNVLDIVVRPDGTWRLKDADELDLWVAKGRFTPEETTAVRAEGERIARNLEAGNRWWRDDWLQWEPDPAWGVPPLPADWADLGDG